MRLLIAIFLSFIISTLLSANEHFKLYKFKSGMVYYDVKTASFDDNLNSQVEGIAKLVFDNWGLKELKEEDMSEIQQGDFNESQSRHTLTEVDNGTVYSVDFNEKKILKTRDRDLDLAIAQKLDLSNQNIKSLENLGAKKVGTEKVANYECDVWEYKDQQICLYKGRTDDYITSIMDLKKEMKKKGINLQDKNLTVTPELQKDIINALGKRYLEKQKSVLLKQALKKRQTSV